MLLVVNVISFSDTTSNHSWSVHQPASWQPVRVHCGFHAGCLARPGVPPRCARGIAMAGGTEVDGGAGAAEGDCGMHSRRVSILLWQITGCDADQKWFRISSPWCIFTKIASPFLAREGFILPHGIKSAILLSLVASANVCITLKCFFDWLTFTVNLF